MFNKCGFVAVALCALFIGSTLAISPWFSSTYNDVRQTLKRYSYCVKYLDPIKYNSSDESDVLINQIKAFLDTANYMPDQVPALMTLFEDVCNEKTREFPVSDAVPAQLFRESKLVRCKAIDDAMDSMYPILKSAAFNKSERIDFSSIMFKNTSSQNAGPYNLSDLIITSWITSNASMPQVCKITEGVKSYLNRKVSERRESSVASHQTLASSIMAYFESFIDRFISMNRSAYWEGSTLWQQFWTNLRNRLPYSSRANSTIASNTTVLRR